ncbi:MAG: methionyl-tRNA formyltransferase [Chloroflexota bacterium]|nr:MAG: methionyl-tRNA formyltransferase [Chloroflexota bacterium]
MTHVVFMGTPEFAVPTLTALIEAPSLDVVGIVTQPDRPAGRGRRLTPSPVKRVALERGLPLMQPRSLHTPEALAQLATWRPDVIVVAAFGQILRQDVLDLPPHGCLNVHASLLPRQRGAAPVAAAILAGDEVTGVTIMRIDAGLDTGPILAQREEPIRPDDTRARLGKRLARLGAALLVETLPVYLAGDLLPRPQPEEGVTYARQLRKEDGRLDWSHSAIELDRRVRAFTPRPGAFTLWRGRRLKVLRAVPLPTWRGDAPPGTVIAVADGAAVATGEGALRLEEVQLAGKRPMDIAAFLRGQRDFVGSRLD